MSPDSAPLYPTTANEPKVHPAIRKGFVFLPSAGMRLAPEILVLELMREVFFESHYGATGNRYLDPDELDEDRQYRYQKEERAILHALRGRRRKSKQAETQSFYAPAYPRLAAHGWLGKNRERVINNFLFAGPIAQSLWHRGSNAENGVRLQDQLVGVVLNALVGQNSCVDEVKDGRELLSVPLEYPCPAGSEDLARANLREKTSQADFVMRIERDELAERIKKDFLEICDIESKLPRMQWLQLLMTFLRFALPAWVLAQMQITQRIHCWLIRAMDAGEVADVNEIKKALAERNKSLLRPTLTPTRELFEHVVRYMKCRVELNILLYCLDRVRPSELQDRVLSVDGGGRRFLGIEELLVLAKDAAQDIRGIEAFRSAARGSDVRTFLTREGERSPAWRNPLMKGQGKNINEFFRVLYKAELGDEAGGYLLTPEGRGATRGFRVFPGQMLLKTITYLASKEKSSESSRGGGGKLVLQDLEDHFAAYGIDFSAAADARPRLMQELQAMGLLTGSPDAGSSVAVACPY